MIVRIKVECWILYGSRGTYVEQLVRLPSRSQPNKPHQIKLVRVGGVWKFPDTEMPGADDNPPEQLAGMFTKLAGAMEAGAVEVTAGKYPKLRPGRARIDPTFPGREISVRLEGHSFVEVPPTGAPDENDGREEEPDFHDELPGLKHEEQQHDANQRGRSLRKVVDTEFAETFFEALEVHTLDGL